MTRGQCRTSLCSLLVACSLAAFLVLLGAALPQAALAADTQPPTVPTSVVATAGAHSPDVAVLTWSASTDNVEVADYSVWRAKSHDGPFKLLGTTSATAFTDVTGVPGVDYFYCVSARDPEGNESARSAVAGPVRAGWIATPHRAFTSGTNACSSCHAVHDAATSKGLMRHTAASGSTGEVAVCYACHDGQGANANVRTGSVDSFALSSGHTVEESATGGDLTNQCSDCHEAHADPGSSRMVPAAKINGKKVGTTGRAWCLACHDDANSWFGAGYPSPSTPTRDAVGYPITGTFPGSSVYLSAGNAHMLIPETTQTPAAGAPIKREAGDCMYCHTAHRGPSTYDGLRSRFSASSAATLGKDQTSGDYAALCLECHGGAKPAGFTSTPPDIKRFVTAPATNAGHRIKTAGGALPVGSPLPCYECHNPHGSKRGNASMLSDALGASLETTTAVGTRRFCFTCHTAHDTGRGWDSVARTYLVPPVDAKVAGIARYDGVLVLPDVPGHNEADSQSCYDCHGKDYSLDGGINVHNPGNGGDHHSELTTGTATINGVAYAVTCYDCHDVDLPQEHAKPTSSSASAGCTACHPSPRSTIASLNRSTCAQGDCHKVATPTQVHGGIDSAHAPLPTNVGCTLGTGCHSGDLAATHKNASAIVDGKTRTSCQVCHSNGVPSSGDCTMCHGSSPPHPENVNALHEAVLDGPVPVPYHTGVSMVSDIQCITCHGSANLVTLHAGDCTVCHGGGPRDSFTTWNKGCQQGSCHPVIHANAEYGHSDSNGYCEDCHNDSDWSVPCLDCHAAAPDTTPPATTYSPSGTSFTGPTTVTLSATDASGSKGVKDTFYRLDGGPTVKGTQITLAAPTGASAEHVLEYWSSDWSANVEPSNVATITVHKDVTAPTTTSDAKATYAGPVTIRLTATDDSVAGVAHTYYRLDSGPQTEGTVVSLPQPPSGSSEHTVTVWSVDGTGNTETPHSYSFSVFADLVAPTTAMTFTNNSSYVYLTLYPNDPDPSSGIASVFVTSSDPTLRGFYNGGQAWWTGTNWTMTSSWNTQGVKTVTYWSVDKAGNIGSSMTSTIAADWSTPITSSDATASYNGTAVIHLSATDVGSGVAATYWKDGSLGTTQTGTTATIPAPPTGTLSHTLYFWSVDNVGYVETPKSKTFTVSAAADLTPPSGTMSVNAGASFATSTTAYVNSNVTDSGTGMSQMRINPGSGTFGAWISYNATQTITLPSLDGTKTVTAEYRDVAGNVASLSDSIVLDTTPPSGSMSINNGEATATVEAATVNSAMSDATSGMSQMRIDVTGTGNSYGDWMPYVASAPITLPSGNGTKTVRVQYIDMAGLVTTMSDTIDLSAFVDTVPPTTNSNVQPQYTGSAMITLTAFDNVGGSGVAHTYYILDSGTQTEGTQITTSSLGTHTLEFWSVDRSGNPETPHKNVSFEVRDPSTAPQSFSFTGASQSYMVPADVNAVVADLYGGAGGGIDAVSGGRGGCVHVTIPVTPGQVLTVRVGGQGAASLGAAGWPNGGAGDGGHGAGGGGSSSILAGTDILAEAGGGGGADHADNPGGDGGNQGWLPGGDQTGGSIGGAGGGGGWNGGAAYDAHVSGGDGGTSYIAIGTGLLTPGVRDGDGLVVITPLAGASTFSATGADQFFTVPEGVNAITVDVAGSQGGKDGGLGGFVHAIVPVTPGDVLTVRVGDTDGWPNGGAGTDFGGAGGGSSSVLRGGSVILEAGGGGGFVAGSPNPAGAGGEIPATDPGGNQNGADGYMYGAGGGGGWNGGTTPGDDTSGTGGTSRIAVGTGTLTPGAWSGNGRVLISW